MLRATEHVGREADLPAVRRMWAALLSHFASARPDLSRDMLIHVLHVRTPATREAHAHDGERMGRMYGLPAAMVRRYSDVFCYTMHTEYTCLTDSQLSHASLVQ